MTARSETRIGDERTPLQQVIPLDTPYLVFLDPSDICNAHCSWCPSGNLELLASVGRFPQLMELSLYLKIIDDLCAMPSPIKTLRLYKDGEPLLNTDFISMVMYAHRQKRFGAIDTTTNGWLLNPKLNEEINYSGLTKIFISVPQNYNSHYIQNVADLFHGKSDLKIHCKYLMDNDEDDDEIKRFKGAFEGICDTISVEYVSPCWPGIGFNARLTRGIYGQDLPGLIPEVCPYIFYSLAINSDGSVSKCFVDWSHTALVGDLKTESFKDVWNGHPLRVLRRHHLSRYRFIVSGCRDCKQLIYGQPDNLDPYLPEIRRSFGLE